ncbi:mating type protein A-alpha Y6 [Schizophyllum fasciatum]
MEELVPHLKNILVHARGMAALAASRGGHSVSQPSPTHAVSFEPLPLPNIDYLRSSLRTAKLPVKSIAAALAAYEKACLRWKQELEESFAKTAVSISPGNLPLFDALRTRLYTQQVEKWHAQVLEVPAKWTAEMEKQRSHIAATMGPKSAKPKFHPEYRPLLELYFHFNAYPTYADRRVLAEKTGMLTRQITVWFQNHRRRAKGPLSRMSPRAKIPMEEFERERENMARKMIPLLLPPHLKPFALGGDKHHAVDPSAGKQLKGNVNVMSGAEKQLPRKSSKKASKALLAGQSTLLGPEAQADVGHKKKTKSSKKGDENATGVVQDVQMKDATAPKARRRKMKKLPASSARLAAHQSPMDVDDCSAKDLSATVSPAFDAQAELAYARAAYPSPSQYAWVHTRKPVRNQPQDPRSKDTIRLGKGRPSSQACAANPASTVPKHRVSSRLNAMRPPYAFPARYDPDAIPLTFHSAATTKFSFPTDSASFGFKSRIPNTRSTSESIATLISRFDGLRLLCAESDVASPSPSTRSSVELDALHRLRVQGLTVAETLHRQVLPDSYAARCAITYIVPTAPLDSVVVDLPRALEQCRVSPLIPSVAIVQPDDFAPFIALAEKRAKRRARKEKQLQAEKQAKKQQKQAKKERKRAGLPHRAPSSVDAQELASRASSIASDVASSSRKLTKKAARKAAESSSAASRASSVASTARTPSLSSTSSRRSSGMSMPGTPSPEQSLPIVAGPDIDLGGHDNANMSPELMAQLFGDVEESDFANDNQAMQAEPFSQDMLSFSYTDGGAHGAMTSDVNMPSLGDFEFSQPVSDDMNWAASLGLGAQDSVSLNSLNESSNTDLNWLLGQDFNGSQQSSYGSTDPCHVPLTATSQINVLGGTYMCELGGVDNTGAPLDLSDLTFGLGPADDGFAGFGSTPLMV